MLNWKRSTAYAFFLSSHFVNLGRMSLGKISFFIINDSVIDGFLILLVLKLNSF
jgi:hypothetical protein